jgi:hypothetical protein
MTEHAIPWDPIPHEYNRLSDLSVSTLSALPTPTGDGIAVTVSCPPIGDWDTEYEWRLYFANCYAYRDRGEGFWPDALPLTWPPERWAVHGGHVALWEVVESQFIREAVAPESRDHAHHYVLMTHDVAFEVVAEGAHVEDLGLAAE